MCVCVHACACVCACVNCVVIMYLHNFQTAQIVQSIRELFQVVYKMVQQKKKMEETKSKSATLLPNSTSDAPPIAKMVSDSKLLDPPPQYEEQELDRE